MMGRAHRLAIVQCRCRIYSAGCGHVGRHGDAEVSLSEDTWHCDKPRSYSLYARANTQSRLISIRQNDATFSWRRCSCVHIAGVAGSSPTPPTINEPCRRLHAAMAPAATRQTHSPSCFFRSVSVGVNMADYGGDPRIPRHEPASFRYQSTRRSRLFGGAHLWRKRNPDLACQRGELFAALCLNALTFAYRIGALFGGR
jgi:hypothetical protein